MNWKIQIEGDKKHLEDVSNLFSILNFDPRIYKDGENYYLEGSIFENTNGAKEISEIANNFLTLMFNLPHFKTKRNIEPPRIKNIIETIITEEGTRIRTYDPEGEGYSEELIKKDGKKNYTLQIQNLVHMTNIAKVDIYSPAEKDFSRHFRTIEEVNNFFQNDTNNGELLKNLSEYLKPYLENLLKLSSTTNNQEDKQRKEKIVLFLSNLEVINSESSVETLKWFFLYKIYETIRDGVTKGKEKLEKWVGKNSVEKFTCTANLHRHGENKKSENDKECINKYGEMSLSEAEELIISTLLLKYIEEKVKGGAP